MLWVYTYKSTDGQSVDVGPFNSYNEAQRAQLRHELLGNTPTIGPSLANRCAHIDKTPQQVEHELAKNTQSATDSQLCECLSWEWTGGKFQTKHHRNCAYYDAEGDAAEIIRNLCKGIEAWAAEEDGVHPGCYEAYRKAKMSIHEHVRTCTVRS